MNRRQFLARTSAASIGLAASASLSSRAAESANNKVVLGIMGTSRNSKGGDGRGAELAKGFASLPGVEVAYICDVDSRNIEKAIESVMAKAKPETPPKGLADFRRILEDKDVDALVIATPDHWHAPATILACAAGKHVYVEKPCSHNPHEGELMVQAARKHNRHVQLGTQRRSWPVIKEAVQRLHAGDIGQVLTAKCYYFADRPTIGRGKKISVPPWLNYDLWQGPAPERDYQDNLIHYNWHWFWHWGTSELGNNGIHTLDLARWGLNVDFPHRITSSGGKYRYQDDQETPDTNIACFEFRDKSITWEGRSWGGRSPNDPDYDVIFHGTKGSLIIKGGAYQVMDLAGKEISKGSGNGGDAVHLQNFIDTIRNDSKLNAEIEEGHKSTLLCHLGNISYRTGNALQFDAESQRIRDDRRAELLWRRDYRPGWEPKV